MLFKQHSVSLLVSVLAMLLIMLLHAFSMDCYIIFGEISICTRHCYWHLPIIGLFLINEQYKIGFKIREFLK